MSPLLLFGVGFVAAAALWLGLRALPRRIGVIDQVRAFGETRGAAISGDGAAEPLHIVGTVGRRAFTVAYQEDLVRGSVLLVAVDCDAPDGVAIADGVVAEGGALATRFTEVGPEVTGRLGEIVDGLVEMAERMEG